MLTGSCRDSEVAKEKGSMADIHLPQVVAVEVEVEAFGGELYRRTLDKKSGSSISDGTCRSRSDANTKESKLSLDATNQLAYDMMI